MSYNCIKEGRMYTKKDVINAMEYAEVMHEGQFRRTGERYIVHPRRVAELVNFFLSTQFNDSYYDSNLLNIDLIKRYLLFKEEKPHYELL